MAQTVPSRGIQVCLLDLGECGAQGSISSEEEDREMEGRAPPHSLVHDSPVESGLRQG